MDVGMQRDARPQRQMVRVVLRIMPTRPMRRVRRRRRRRSSKSSVGSDDIIIRVIVQREPPSSPPAASHRRSRPSRIVGIPYISVPKGTDSDTRPEAPQGGCQNACSNSGSRIGILYLSGEDHSGESRYTPACLHALPSSLAVGSLNSPKPQ